MKKLILILLFVALFTGIKYAHGQTHEKILIPVLKESKAIDSLMDIILDPNTKSNVGDITKPLQDSSIIFRIIKTDRNLLFDISTETQKNINAMFNYPQQGKISFGYFKYKRINVFAADFDRFSDFFSTTSNFKSLNFIYKLKEPSFDLPDGLSPKSRVEWNFQYKDGHFSKRVFNESQLLIYSE